MPRKRQGPSPDAAARAAVQPPRAPTGLPYGEHQDLMNLQAEQPVDNAQGRMDTAVQTALDGSQAPLGDGQVLAQPTALPNEPVQTGLPMGPGAGPEVVPPIITPTSLDDWGMARYLPMLESLADAPGVSNQTRNWVRRIRGSLPVDVTMQSITRGK